jgi:glyoxalase/bleomycin resistance protein/dioxygenase superfamily protein
MLHHVALETRPADVDDAVAFWRILGFSLVDAPPTLTGTATWLERNGTQIHLLYAEEPTVAPQGHPAVVVEDFDSVYAAVEAAGHPIERRREHWGAPRARAVSPGGHQVELMAAPPS